MEKRDLYDINRNLTEKQFLKMKKHQKTDIFW